MAVAPPAVKPNQAYQANSYRNELYRSSNGFYARDPLSSYTSMTHHQSEKPLHLLEYDLRFFELNNNFTRGNPLYNADNNQPIDNLGGQKLSSPGKGRSSSKKNLLKSRHQNSSLKNSSVKKHLIPQPR